MCKRIVRLICITMTIVLLISIIQLRSYVSASDTSGHWAEEVIFQWREKGLVNGYTDGTFRPKNDISRAEFMELVNNAFDYTEETEIDYKDVYEDKWYMGTIKRAAAAGYISGYEDGTMKPDNPITREEVAAIITRIMKLNLNEKGAEVFKDREEIKWSRGYVGAVATEGYMIGLPDGRFRPLNNITRGEAIYALNNIIDKKEVQAMAKQDFFGITYIRVIWNKGVKPSSVKADGKELVYDEATKEWKGTSLDLDIGDIVKVIVIQDGIETNMDLVVKDILDN